MEPDPNCDECGELVCEVCLYESAVSVGLRDGLLQAARAASARAGALKREADKRAPGDVGRAMDLDSRRHLQDLAADLRKKAGEVGA